MSVTEAVIEFFKALGIFALLIGVPWGAYIAITKNERQIAGWLRAAFWWTITCLLGLGALAAILTLIAALMHFQILLAMGCTLLAAALLWLTRYGYRVMRPEGWEYWEEVRKSLTHEPKD
jgi:hypothetical protein